MRLTAFCLVALIVFSTGIRDLRAQIQNGTIQGSVTDLSGAVIPGCEIVLVNEVSGFHRTVVAGEQGAFVLANVPLNSYTIRATFKGFQTVSRKVSVNSNIPIVIDLVLSPMGISESVSVQAPESLVQTDSTGSKTTVDESSISRLPQDERGRQLQNVVATAPGWRTENDGLLHVRGVDDGVLYVVDGIPVTDRIDVLSGNSLDTESIRSLTVITGSIPAEFGDRSGAVVVVQSKSMIGMPLTGSLGLSGGSFRSDEVNGTLGGNLSSKAGFFLSVSGERSGRFLDPVDPRNFNNLGGSLKLNVRTDWRPTQDDTFLFTVSANGTDFHVTNNLEQELAGQRQRQELRDNGESLRWQHVWSSRTVTDVAYFRQSYDSKLLGSAFDTPLFAHAHRTDERQGVVADANRSIGKHTLKLGFDVARVSLREFFTFAVTDPQTASNFDISAPAVQFTPAHPFLFQDQKTRGDVSAYVEDSFSPIKSITINAGVRYDHSNLLIADQQLSPRLGIVYYIKKTGTAVRGSFDRLYMPPQIENLLLSSSEQARQLSPFATPAGGGSALVLPERVSAWEFGFGQNLYNSLAIEGAYWHRDFRNFADPNVLFNTTIIFPNSIASGFAQGADLRINMPERKGWTGYVSYGNATIVQIGPINGGLFLTNDFIEIGPGTRFTPDHDERNSASFAITHKFRRAGAFASLLGRYESGVPVEVDQDQLKELESAPGADLVNFARGRVKPWTVLDLTAGWEVLKESKVSLRGQIGIENITNWRFVYNFGNPFSGTHFGYPRLWNARLAFEFH